MKQHLSWSDIYDKIRFSAKFRLASKKVWGVPRGGVYIAQAICNTSGALMAESPEEADVIVDDIIDSGATREQWQKRFPEKPFVALYDYTEQRGPWLVFPWEQEVEAAPEENIRRLLQYIGEDPQREGLLDTPQRFIKAMQEMTVGYKEDPADHLGKKFTLDDTASGVVYDEMIISRDIPFVSLCEHHMLPFNGTVSIAYIPGEGGCVVGLSKLARMAEGYARRLQVQERLTAQIAAAIADRLSPLGVGVVVEARHSCQCMRGVQKSGSMITSALKGVMRADPAVRAEFFSLVRG